MPTVIIAIQIIFSLATLLLFFFAKKQLKKSQRIIYESTLKLRDIEVQMLACTKRKIMYLREEFQKECKNFRDKKRSEIIKIETLRTEVMIKSLKVDKKEKELVKFEQLLLHSRKPSSLSSFAKTTKNRLAI